MVLVVLVVMLVVLVLVLVVFVLRVGEDIWMVVLGFG